MQKFHNAQLYEADIMEELKQQTDFDAARHAHMIHGTDISIEESQGPIQSIQGSDQVLLPSKAKRDPIMQCSYGDYVGDEVLLVGGGEIRLDDSPEMAHEEEEKQFTNAKSTHNVGRSAGAIFETPPPCRDGNSQ